MMSRPSIKSVMSLLVIASPVIVTSPAVAEPTSPAMSMSSFASSVMAPVASTLEPLNKLNHPRVQALSRAC